MSNTEADLKSTSKGAERKKEIARILADILSQIEAGESYASLKDDDEEYCGHWILTAPDNHDIELDYVGFAHRPRITCHTCNKTLVYQPFMASSRERSKAEFLAEHPTED